jgi:CheY-like chemotaxis protein
MARKEQGMTTLREAAQQALEAWEQINKYGFVLADYEGPMEQAITALKAALEQPEQAVPVAWMDPNSGEVCRAHWLESHAPERDVDRFSCPLYTHPPRREWRGLSEEEFGYIYVRSATHEEFARAIEAALRSKNHE